MAEGSLVIAEHLEARERAKMVDRVKIIFYLLAAVASVMLAGAMIKPLNAERADLQIQFNPDIFRQVPPDIAMLSTTLGPLRGLWIYTLWIQADKLKEERRFYDALQRAQWICKLQPRFPATLRNIGVSNEPGQMALTLIPHSATSRASVRVNPDTAPFDAA